MTTFRLGSEVDLGDDLGLVHRIHGSTAVVKSVTTGQTQELSLDALRAPSQQSAEADLNSYAIALWATGESPETVSSAVGYDSAALHHLRAYVQREREKSSYRAGDAVVLKGARRARGTVVTHGPGDTLWVDFVHEAQVRRARVREAVLEPRYTLLMRARRGCEDVLRIIQGQGTDSDDASPDADPDLGSMERVQDEWINLQKRPSTLQPDDLPVYADIIEVNEMTAAMVEDVLNSKIQLGDAEELFTKRKEELQAVVSQLPEFKDVEDSRTETNESRTRFQESVRYLVEAIETEEGLRDEVEVAAFRRVQSSALQLAATVDRKYTEFVLFYYRRAERTTPATVANKLRVADQLKQFMQQKEPRRKDKIEELVEAWKEAAGLYEAATTKLRVYVALFPKTRQYDEALKTRDMEIPEIQPDERAMEVLRRLSPKQRGAQRTTNKDQTLFDRIRTTLGSFFSAVSGYVGKIRRIIDLSSDVVDDAEDMATQIDQIREAYVTEMDQLIASLS